MNHIYNGDCLEILKQLPDNSIDSCVTDPPYGLSKEPNISEVLTKWINGEPYDHRHGGFMGKKWDSFVPHPDIFKEVYRVLKHGGYALVFAGTRTQDLMTISLRLAGFEVRDVIEWLYFSGFPKSMDVGKAFDKREGAGHTDNARPNRVGKETKLSGVQTIGGEITEPQTDLAKQYDGWGTALKPAHEPIIVVRKPLIGTVADNVEKYGTGAVNVDGCRISFDGEKPKEMKNQNIKNNSYNSDNGERERDTVYIPNDSGRFPANIITTEPDAFYSKYCNVTPAELCKKASKKDRNSDWLGVEIDLEEKQGGGMQGSFDKTLLTGSGNERSAMYRNNHPTVKPTDLMAWLIRLVTPTNGTVLDPFAGSGSTLVTAKREGFSYIGIEREAEYVEICKARTAEKDGETCSQTSLF